MTTEQFYFLILVVASFVTFMVVTGANYITYRRWLKRQPVVAPDRQDTPQHREDAPQRLAA